MAIDSITPLSLTQRDNNPKDFAHALGDSFARYGFAIVADHGIPDAVIGGTVSASHAFFALPEETKRRYFVPGGGGQRGYTPFGVEIAKGAPRADLKEFWHTGRNVTPGSKLAEILPPNLHVTEIPGFDKATYSLFETMDALGLKILGAVADYLGLPTTFFDRPVGTGNSILRLLHYPPLAPNAEGVRAGAHEDINVITLLLGAEEAGLELLDRDGNWLAVNPPPGCAVINIGDMLQRLTNHLLPSTTHRVVNPTGARRGLPRYSMPFFQHFASEYMIETLPSCVSGANPNRYPTPISADDYLRERLREIGLIK